MSNMLSYICKSKFFRGRGHAVNTYRDYYFIWDVSLLIGHRSGLAPRQDEAPLGVHPFLNFKGAKGLKVSIWSMMEGSNFFFEFH